MTNSLPAASASRHTPEPWNLVTSPFDELEVRGPNSQFVAQCLSADSVSNPPLVNETRKANAARIVSCANALAGMNPEAVKSCLEKLQYACDYPLAMAQNSGFRQEVHAALTALKGGAK